MAGLYFFLVRAEHAHTHTQKKRVNERQLVYKKKLKKLRAQKHSTCNELDTADSITTIGKNTRSRRFRRDSSKRRYTHFHAHHTRARKKTVSEHPLIKNTYGYARTNTPHATSSTRQIQSIRFGKKNQTGDSFEKTHRSDSTRTLTPPDTHKKSSERTPTTLNKKQSSEVCTETPHMERARVGRFIVPPGT